MTALPLASGHLLRWNYIPATLCWIASLAYLALFCLHAWASYKASWDFESVELLQVMVIGYALIGTILLIGFGLSIWLGFRARQGRWKFALGMLILSYVVFHATASTFVSLVERLANS
ncbi:hypothetical protein Poly41_26430 [Novipirellula artificiosorum]|uniref:Uncharacterized protein n=2 Tax=Novipirellula artificiosorum TaxID=2528016 RepID=A0A5C6DV13_9BACT|nr:hypothetical protein Poly41_26430 [Novipirellula artificiosorum]